MALQWIAASSTAVDCSSYSGMVMMEHTYRLDITRRWNGDAAPTYPGAFVRVTTHSAGVTFQFEGPRMGDPAPVAVPGRLWKLWEHEVLECFVVGPDERYLEIEVGPHGHYLALALRYPRQVVDADVPVSVSWPNSGEERWSARVEVATEHLPKPPWRMNAFAIYGDARRTYLAATPVPGDSPDFHRLSAYRESEYFLATPRRESL